MAQVENDELFEKLKQLIVDQLDIEADKVTKDAGFRDDLHANSLDTYELVYAIEEQMNIKIEDEDASKFETVGDAYEFLKSKLA